MKHAKPEGRGSSNPRNTTTTNSVGSFTGHENNIPGSFAINAGNQVLKSRPHGIQVDLVNIPLQTGGSKSITGLGILIQLETQEYQENAPKGTPGK